MGRGFIETVFLGLQFLIQPMIPAFVALFPGSASTWVRLPPSYGLVETTTGITTL